MAKAARVLKEYSMNHRTEILDLRTALQALREIPGQLIETDIEVDPAAELSGVYRHVGAGGTVKRLTQIDGPAMVFHNIMGHPGTSVVIGVLASRERVAKLFGCKKEELAHLVRSCANNPIQPVVIDRTAPCQEMVHLATDPDFDLFKLVPAPTNTPVDAGPCISCTLKGRSFFISRLRPRAGRILPPCASPSAALHVFLLPWRR